MESVVVPALVAAVVTLGIEYFAKPSLEVRKQRITETYQAHRQALAQYRRLSYYLGSLSVVSQPGQVWPERQAEHRKKVRDALDRMKESLSQSDMPEHHLAEAAMSRLGAACEAYLIMAAAGDFGHSTEIAVLEGLERWCDLCDEAIRTPRWRWRKRRRLSARF